LTFRVSSNHHEFFSSFNEPVSQLDQCIFKQTQLAPSR